MADGIDFSKVDAAFQQLADTDEGQAALDGLAAALDGVLAVAADLNDEEQHYVLVHLVNQREDGPATDDELFQVPDAKPVARFRILSAVPTDSALALQRATISP